MVPALEISHLRKVYRSGTVAVEDVSLTIQPGDFFGFLGPNGAGKSTTIHCITGISNPTSGSISVRRVPVATSTDGASLVVSALNRAFFLTDSYLPRSSFAHWHGTRTLTAASPTAVLWPTS